MSDTLLFAFCLVDTGALLFLLVYYVITLSGESGLHIAQLRNSLIISV